ncbi:unnamed protein product [Ectocarpus sp. 8 AP-2014]
MLQSPQEIVYYPQLKGVFSQYVVTIWPLLHVSGREVQVLAGNKDYREGRGGRVPDLLRWGAKRECLREHDHHCEEVMARRSGKRATRFSKYFYHGCWRWL